MTTTWADRHQAALAQPRGNERTIVRLMQALAFYKGSGGVPVGEDYVLGPAWVKIASGLLDLLNGDIGRLDGGLVDHAVRQMASDRGFTDDDL